MTDRKIDLEKLQQKVQSNYTPKQKQLIKLNAEYKNITTTLASYITPEIKHTVRTLGYIYSYRLRLIVGMCMLATVITIITVMNNAYVWTLLLNLIFGAYIGFLFTQVRRFYQFKKVFFTYLRRLKHKRHQLIYSLKQLSK